VTSIRSGRDGDRSPLAPEFDSSIDSTVIPARGRLAQAADIDVRGAVWPRAQWISRIGGLSDDVDVSVADHVRAEARQVHCGTLARLIS
jgi:hypothetical protein